MKTVYGPIFPITGGGVDGSLLIGIFELKLRENGRKLSDKNLEKEEAASGVCKLQTVKVKTVSR